MFCPKCGQQIRDGLKFCTKCGASLMQYGNSNGSKSSGANIKKEVNNDETQPVSSRVAKDDDQTEVILKKRDNGSGYQKVYTPPEFTMPSNADNKKQKKDKPKKKKKSNPVVKIIIILLILLILGAVGTTVWFFGGFDMITESLGIETIFSSDKTDKSDKAKSDDKDDKGDKDSVKHEKPKKGNKTDKAKSDDKDDKDNKDDKNDKDSVKHEKPKKGNKTDTEASESSEESSAQTNMPPTVAYDSTNTQPTVLASSEYIIPDSDTRVLEEKDIQGFTAEQCRLARNELYARHGRIFDDASLQSHFQACSWYHGTIPASDFSESMLNEVEIKNRDLILTYEKKMGYRQ